MFVDSSLVPAHTGSWLGATKGGNPRSQELVWVACSAVELSCTLLYLDPIFVKQEDLSDRALVFHL